MSEHMRARLVTAGLLALVFVAGLVVGVAADRTLMSAAPLQSAEPAERSEDSSESAESGSRRWIIDQVDLSGDQRIRVDSLVDFHRDRMAELTRECGDHYGSIIEATRDDLRALLTTEQRLVYDSLLEVRDRRRAQEKEGGRS